MKCVTHLLDEYKIFSDWRIVGYPSPAGLRKDCRDPRGVFQSRSTSLLPLSKIDELKFIVT